MVILISLIISIVLNDTTPAYEQLALNHFFKKSFSQNYPDLKSVELATQTDTNAYFGIIYSCTQWDELTTKETLLKHNDSPKELKLPESDIAIKRIRGRSKRLKISVSPRKRVGDTYFVLVKAYKKLSFVNYYFYQFDSSGRLIDTCEKGEII